MLSRQMQLFLQNELCRIKEIRKGAGAVPGAPAEGLEDEYTLIVTSFNDVVRQHVQSLSKVLAMLEPSGEKGLSAAATPTPSYSRKPSLPASFAASEKVTLR
jgi:hypothetical protein